MPVVCGKVCEPTHKGTQEELNKVFCKHNNCMYIAKASRINNLLCITASCIFDKVTCHMIGSASHLLTHQETPAELYDECVIKLYKNF